MLKPFKMTPYFSEKDWGGQRLKTVFDKRIPSNHTGESWEVSAHPQGPSAWQGQTLPQIVARYGQALTGTCVPAQFPLLIKLIDAREWLSVQVHPDDAYARRVEGDPYGKTEAWVVLDCEPGAQLVYGIDCDTATLGRELEAGRLEAHLNKVAVKPGDVLYIPAGTVHAIGPGMLIYEVQQSSDRTYRLHAWGRDAQLHIQKSLEVIDPAAGGRPLPGARLNVAGGTREALVLDPMFSLERLTASGRMEMETDGTRFYAYTAVGEGEISYEGGRMAYAKGDSFLVPATLGQYALEGGTLYQATLPDMDRAVAELTRLGADLSLVAGKR